MASWVVPAFLAGVVASLFASSQLVQALERIGAQFGFPEVLLGFVAALAADSPELTSALAAEASGKRDIGVGVLFGSNVFNIAALMGLSALVAGRVPLHRRVVALEGFSAMGVAGCALAIVGGALGGAAAAVPALAVFVSYFVVSIWPSSAPLPRPWRRWLAQAVNEESEELSPAETPPERAAVRGDLSRAGVSLVAVVAASVVMERAASAAGSSLHLPQAIVGGVVLAAVTSLPNAVAAVQLARSGKGPAVLSEAMNSNTVNVMGGIVLPAAVGGFAFAASGPAGAFASASYALMTVLALALAYGARGVGRRGAAVLIGAYGAFVVGLVLVSSG